MNITELDSYNLADAVKFNDTLNPAIWQGQTMKPEVRERLMTIAQDFKEFLGLSDLEVKDITLSGSNAGYTYTPYSDIDLHLVVDIPQADESDVYRELFDAKKYQYNDQHNITIGGYDVELYVEDARKQPVSQGIYSVLNNDWVRIPLKQRATVNDEAVKSKFEDIGHRIESAVASQDGAVIEELANKIKNMRQAGLDAHGELGAENLAYKMLRNQGVIKKLYNARAAAKDAELSLNERRKKKTKKKTKYGYGGYFYPGFGFAGSGEAPADGGGDGGGGESVHESAVSTEDTVTDFVGFCVEKLNIEQQPQIRFKRDPAWSARNRTFGSYNHDTNELIVSLANRHVMDILRTVAHELTHQRQGEVADVPDHAGETGSRWENEANARAGVLMREYGQHNPSLFAEAPVEEGVKEKLGALAAAACIAGTPGCATTTAGAVKDIQTVGRTAQTVKGMTKQGVKAELDQELQNFLRAQGQGPGSANAKNQSRLYQLQKQMQNKDDVKEASGYIPTKKQAKLPQFSNALSVDVQPGAVGKEANKLSLNTDSQGHPALLIKGLKNALREFKETGRVSAKLNEFAPSAKRDDDDIPDQLLILANRWWNATDRQPQIESVLNSMGWSIRQVESEDDAVQLQHQDGTTYFISADDFDPDLFESEQLDEVRMSPSALSKFASSPEAEGIRAGFEAELIFRDTRGDDDDDQEMEADYDADERTRTIDGVIEFFSNDDWGYGIGERQANQLRDELDEAYFEWRDEQIIRDFDQESEDLVREVWLEERPMNERILSALVDGIGLDDAEADKILAIGDKAPRFTKSSDQTAYKEANPGYDKYLEAVDIADAILDEEVEASIDRQDGYYDSALEEFRDGWEGDDSGFFDDQGLRWMSDVANNYGLDWPYMSGGGSSNYGNRDWDEIGESLRNATGMPVKVSSGYHSQKRGDYYVVEPDGSLDPDNKSEEAGLEIVSPPMPLNQAIEQLQKVIEWANDPDQGNAYTNRSTGLHMGVSIPYKGGDVDYLKLILFMGDKYVLDKFGRAANTYTASAMEKLRQNVAGSRNRNDDKIASALELMKSNLLELAQRYVQQGVGNSKYTSAHIKDGYIEFRSPGGDYLAKADEEINVLEDTMRRFAYAMYLAGRPDLERPEYYKKLYKLIAPEGNKDLELFSKFSAGEITADQLKKQWAEKVISKEVPSTDKKSNWRLYNRFTDKPVPGLEFSNYTELDALERAKARVSPASSMTDFNLTYELRDIGTNTGRWNIVQQDTDETLEIVDAATRGEAVDYAHDKYSGGPDNVNFYVIPYTGNQESEPKPKLSRRAKLATQIAQPKDYVIVNKHSLLPFYTFRASTMSQAVDFAVTYLQDKNLDVGNFTVQRASNVKQAVDNAVDSRRMQQRLDPQVRDIDITIDQDSDQYEIVDRRNNRVLLQYRADDAADAGDKFNNWLRNQGMPADTENYGYRPMVAVFESIDDAQKARNAMDAAAKKLGYANFAAVPQSAKNTVMQMAVNALKLDSGHYNMLDRKNKR
jgi:hypothetical protein